MLKAGRELRESRPDVYAVWFLGYYFALRAGEIEQAKRSWLREMVPTEVHKETAVWLLNRSTFWVLDMSADPDVRLKTVASAGMIPVADDVAAEFLRICGDREFVLPGGDRHALAHREFSAWLRGKGWEREKTTHELRAYRQQVWDARYGREVSESWVRHGIKGVAAHYLGRLNVTRRPLGLDE